MSTERCIVTTDITYSYPDTVLAFICHKLVSYRICYLSYFPQDISLAKDLVYGC